MAASSLDILNLSHSLRDLCEVNQKCPDCLSQTLQTLLQYNLIQANLSYGRQFCPPLFSGRSPDAAGSPQNSQSLGPACAAPSAEGLALSNALLPERRP